MASSTIRANVTSIQMFFFAKKATPIPASPRRKSLRWKKFMKVRTTRTENQFIPASFRAQKSAATVGQLEVTGATNPQTSLGFGFTAGFFANMVYDKKDWDIFHANLDDATALADQKAGSMLNATDPNLAAFKAHGGKLIIYHGWNDPAISAINTINYYNSVIAKMGGQNADTFVRVYMVPGMQHCGGGPGADNFGDAISATPTDPQHSLQLSLEQWVEKNSAPATIIATKLAQGTRTPAITRPLCAYPQSAKYNGSCDPNSAASFTCAK